MTHGLFSPLLPVLLYCVHTVGSLDGEKCVFVNHSHVNKFEQEGNFRVIISRQQNVCWRQEIPSLHPKLHCGLGWPPPQSVTLLTDLGVNKIKLVITLTHSTIIAVPFDLMFISKGGTQPHATPVSWRASHLFTGKIKNGASCLKQSLNIIAAREPMMSSSHWTCCHSGKAVGWSQGSSAGSSCEGWSCTVSSSPMTGRWSVEGAFFNPPPILLRCNKVYVSKYV